MREIVVNLIFILGAINLILFLVTLILILINKIYGVLVNFKFKTIASAIEYLAKKEMECEKICKVIDFIRERAKNERD